MALSSKERHALATRIRLGEVLPLEIEERHYNYPWRTKMVDCVGEVYVFERRVLWLDVRKSRWFWENGSPYETTTCYSLSNEIMRYLDAP